MKTSQFSKLAAVLLLASGLSACGGGGSGGGSSDLAGIGGTGIIAAGQITAFGSIFVNGVEYFVQPGTTITVNGDAAQESDLRLGMIVTLSGTLNSSGVTGTLDAVAYEAELVGPVTDIDPDGSDPNGKIKTLVILGKSVIVDAIKTSFGDDGSIGNGYSFSTIAINDIVEVSGYVIDNNGTLHAARIEKEGDYTPGSTTPVEVKGTVTALTQSVGSFILDGVLTVDFDPDNANITIMTSLVNGVAIGDDLEIKGTFTNPTTIFANEIKPSDDGLPENAGLVEIDGIITNFVNDSNFKVNGQDIDASNALLDPASLALGDGMFVEVRGAVVNGTLEATSVEADDGDIEIQAYVSGVPVNNTIRLQVTSVGFIDVTVASSRTQMADDVSNAPISLSDISDGNFLKITAYQDSNGEILALQIRRLSSDEGKILLDGPATSWSMVGGNLSVTVLGVSLSSSAATSFGKDDQPLTGGASEMNDLLNTFGSSAEFEVNDGLSGSTVSDGIVDSMDIET